MMLLFFIDDQADRFNRHRVLSFQYRNLVLKMLEHYAFNCNRCRGDSAVSTQARNQAQDQTAQPAKVIAATAWMLAPREFGGENVSVLQLMRAKFTQFIDQSRCRQAGHKYLAGIDVHCAVFARMVDFDNPITKCVGCRMNVDCSQKSANFSAGD